MHELAIAQEIADVCGERCGGARVTRVVMRVGRLTAVLPDSLRFCFELATRGTPLEGASLEIVEEPARMRCRSCGVESELERHYLPCRCGSYEREWLAGTALRVDAMEVV
jgi:hydrogenase nickel incorporation protein HypA/HybF